MKKLLRISVGICLTFCVFLTASAQGGSEVCADHESRIKAEQGDSNAQIMLGFCYHSAGNSKQEVFWYHKSAEQGNSMAQVMLGSIYNEGVRVPQDYKLAISWYQKAAEQGAPIALLNLGAMYAKGQGVPQSYKDCYFWFILAAAKGDQEVRQEAQKGRGLCEAKLTPSSIEEVQERAAGYFEKF